MDYSSPHNTPKDGTSQSLLPETFNPHPLGSSISSRSTLSDKVDIPAQPTMVKLQLNLLCALYMLHLVQSHDVGPQRRQEPIDFSSNTDQPKTTTSAIDIGDVAKSIIDFTTALSGQNIVIGNIPAFNDFTKTAPPTADFTSLYVSGVVQAISSFLETRSSGQKDGFSFPCKSR